MMPLQQKIDSIAVFVLGIVGAVFTLFSAGAFKNIDADCPSAIIRNSWTAILTIGACMITACIAFFVCTLLTGSCYSEMGGIRTADMYFGFFSVFNLVIIGLCSAILKEYGDLKKDKKTSCDDTSENNKKYIFVILILAGLSLLICGGFWIKDYLSETKDIIEFKPETKQATRPRNAQRLQDMISSGEEDEN